MEVERTMSQFMEEVDEIQTRKRKGEELKTYRRDIKLWKARLDAVGIGGKIGTLHNLAEAHYVSQPASIEEQW